MTRPRRRLRDEVQPSDEAKVRALVSATGFFSAEECDIAAELVRERLQAGDASGYRFVLLDDDDGLAGYACYGPIPGTDTSYDLYWIAVRPSKHRQGMGRRLLRLSERCIARDGGTRIYVDTSSREQYAPTRAFYEGCGYHVAAHLADFYRPGDGKVIYCKVLASR